MNKKKKNNDSDIICCNPLLTFTQKNLNHPKTNPSTLNPQYDNWDPNVGFYVIKAKIN